MSRRKTTAKREILADPVYNDVTVAKFVNKMMWQGKKDLVPARPLRRPR